MALTYILIHNSCLFHPCSLIRTQHRPFSFLSENLLSEPNQPARCEVHLRSLVSHPKNKAKITCWPLTKYFFNENWKHSSLNEYSIALPSFNFRSFGINSTRLTDCICRLEKIARMLLQVYGGVGCFDFYLSIRVYNGWLSWFGLYNRIGRWINKCEV